MGRANDEMLAGPHPPLSSDSVDTLAVPSSVARTGVRVLVVDDELPACKLLALMLAQPQFQCSTANTGEDALAALQREPFDAVISDLRMQGLGGMEILERVRRSYPHIAFLVTTGVDDVEVGVRAMRCGADDYLVKPLHETAVRTSLEKALHKHRLEQEVDRYRFQLEQTVAERTRELQSALKQIERSYEDTLEALGAAVDLRDNETAGHSRRVCLYSMRIARAMGWEDEKLRDLARGAYLHDIGKLGVPDSILLKPGPLTSEEREVMQRHAQIGFDLIREIPFLASAAEIVLCHHERYDGFGYPRGLKGLEIPASARIFSVADTLDAMTSQRPYRQAATFEHAHDTIRELAGTQCDPEAISVFLKIPKGTWKTLALSLRDGGAVFKI
jgi:putative nucleotidyltransferase with HDIG domain